MDAHRRVNEHSTPAGHATIMRWKAGFGLTDEVVLALRLLTPNNLSEFLAGESSLRAKLRGESGARKSEIVMQLIEAIDADAAALVRTLSYAGSDISNLVAGTAAKKGGVSEEGTSLVAEARQRMAECNTPQSKALAKRWGTDFGISAEAQLALRLLKPLHLQEILAAEPDVKEKMKTVSDTSGVVLRLISELDASATKLARDLSAAGSKDNGADDEEDAAALVVAAQKRLAECKSNLSNSLVARWKEHFGIGEAAELALRMLKAPHVNRLWLTDKERVQQRMKSTTDRSALALKVVAEIDASAAKLARGLKRAQGDSSDEEPWPEDDGEPGGVLGLAPKRALSSGEAGPGKGKSKAFFGKGAADGGSQGPVWKKGKTGGHAEASVAWKGSLGPQSSEWPSSEWDSPQDPWGGKGNCKGGTSPWDSSPWNSSPADASQWGPSPWDSSQGAWGGKGGCKGGGKGGCSPWDSSPWDSLGWNNSPVGASQWGPSEWDCPPSFGAW